MNTGIPDILPSANQKTGGDPLSKDCLLIIDLQRGFINEHTSHLPQKITECLARRSFSAVIATRYCNTPSTACYRLGGWRDCMEGTPAAELVPELMPHVQRIFDKHTFSGCTRELQTFLHEAQFDRLYICGVNTDCCVLATVFACYDAVQELSVIEYLCGSTLGPHKHRNAIELMRDNITPERIITASDFEKEATP